MAKDTFQRIGLFVALGLVLCLGGFAPGTVEASRDGPDSFGVRIVSAGAEAGPSVAQPTNYIFHAESHYTFSPYWGRYSYPDYDLGFTVEFAYPHPYAELAGEPIPGNYVDSCVHDEAQHLVRCTGTFPRGTPDGARAEFTYSTQGTCALFPNPPAHVYDIGTLRWSDGGTSQLQTTFDVAPVLEMGMVASVPADGARDVPIVDAGGQAPLLQWTPYQPLACNIFPMPDSFDTSYAVELRRVGGSWQTVGGFGNCNRQIQLQPSQLPCAANGEPVTWEWRVSAYDYKYGRCRAQNPVETLFRFTAGSCRPEISVTPQYGNAYFLNNVSVQNTYRVDVDWTGTAFAAPASPPYGDVHFILNGQETVVPGQSWGAEHTIDMGRDVNASWGGGNNTLEIYADYDGGTGQKTQSARYTAQPLAFPFPEWATTFSAGPFTADLGAGAVTYESGVSYPREPFEANVIVPNWVPYLGGKEVGILETQAGAEVSASSKGTGKLGVGGQTGLGLGVDIIGGVRGNGDFVFGVGDGLRLKKSEFGLSIAARFEKTATLGDLVPGMRAAESWWIVGPFIRKLNNLAKITGTLVPRVAVTAFFEQAGHSDWVFTGSVGRGEIGATIRGDLKLLEKLYAWAEGGGTPFIELNFPPAPNYLRELGIDLSVKAGFRAWGYQEEWQRAITCSLPQAGCRQKEEEGQLLALVGDAGWTLVGRDYVTPGYHTFTGQHPQRQQTAAGSATVETLLASNVYPLSEPALAVRADGQRTLLYIHDDPARPLGQGMELLATQWTGAAWSAPLSLTGDLRLDFSPQVVYDGAGNAVALWERSYTDAITTGLTITFMQSLDIGTATWYSATQSWGPVAMLTEANAQADFAPRLRAGADGSVLALWETNDGNDLLGTVEHPMTYTYALWDGSAWTAPRAALAGLTNTFGADVAIFSTTQAALVTVYDADLVSSTVGTDLFYSLYDGSGWSALQRITDDTDEPVSDTAPSLVYDADGSLKLVWLRGSDLVMLDGSWDSADLQVVRPNSDELGFLDPTLVRSPQGHLALAWQSGHAGLFDLAYSVYDAGAQRWGADQYLMQDDALEIAVSPAFGADGTLHLAYRKQQTEYVTETVVFSPTLVVTFTNVARAGASDLYVLEHTVGRDLSLSDLHISPAYPAPGAPVTLTVQVHNTGDLTAGPVVVRFDDDSDGDGTPLSTLTVTVALTAGTSVTATAHWTAPASITGTHLLRATVDPDGSIAELDETNNTVTLAAFGPRLVAEWAEWAEAAGAGAGQGLTATLSVANAGSSALLAPVTVLLHAGDALAGPVVATGTLGAGLAPGARAVVSVPVADPSLLAGHTTGWLIAGPPAPDLANAWPIDLQLQPDLSLAPADVAASGYGSLELLPRGSFSATIRNTGPVTASGVTLAAYAEGLTGTLLFSHTFAQLGPQAAAMGTFTCPTSSLPHALWFRIDPQGAIAESDETNNLALLIVEPIGPLAPDYRLYLPLVLRDG